VEFVSELVDPIVETGSLVRTDDCVQRTYYGLGGSSAVSVEFVRTPRAIKAAADGRLVRIVPDDKDDGVSVLRSHVVAKLSFDFPAHIVKAEDKRIEVRVYFARSEITSEVTFVRTGEVKRAAITYTAKREGGGRGASAADEEEDSDADAEAGAGGAGSGAGAGGGGHGHARGAGSGGAGSGGAGSGGAGGQRSSEFSKATYAEPASAGAGGRGAGGGASGGWSERGGRRGAHSHSGYPGEPHHSGGGGRGWAPRGGGRGGGRGGARGGRRAGYGAEDPS